MTRNFDDKPAVREQTPVLVGLVGPSGGGKTFSALRLATGIQTVTGGDIYGIDTEARRMLAYADKFKFRHLAFGAPHSPLDYLEAIEHCVRKGAKTLVIDSMSLEHEGVGGVLEWHEREMGGDFKKQMIAWAKPKAARRRLINTILQIPANFVFCFRAKEKLKVIRGKEPQPMGFMAIGGDEWIYEMTMSTLLLPNCNGVPTWQSEEIGERLTIKLPEQFKSIFPRPEQLTEVHGRKMAEWAAGAPPAPQMTAAELVASYERCADPATFRQLEQARAAIWSTLSKSDKTVVKTASDATQKAIEESAKAPEVPVPDDADGAAQEPAA